MYCSVRDQQVTLRDDFCLDEDGKAVHTDRYVKRILQENSAHSLLSN
jgi:hypothetical protein